jgi:hypothetical protein
MEEFHHHDWFNDLVALAGIPAPFLIPFVDESMKIAALAYSCLGAAYMVKQLFKRDKKD